MTQMETAASSGKDKGEHDRYQVVAIGGRPILFRSPGSGAIAMLATRLSGRDQFARVGGLIRTAFLWMVDPDEIFDSLTDEELEHLEDALEFSKDDNVEFLEGLMDRSEIEPEEIISALEELMERWSARPTEKSSASARSRAQSGRRSTAASRRAR